MIHSKRKKHSTEGRTAENAGDAARESLIPMRSRPDDAMSELARPPAPLVPPLAAAACIACVAGAGALANCSVLAALLKSSRTGLCSIIIQMILADFLIIGTSALPELWFYNHKTWKFGKNACVAYRGLAVFSSTVLSYLVATIALHTIATINVEEKAVKRTLQRNDNTEDEEMGSSHHSLVANSDSSTPRRTMNVDYSLMTRRVPVTPPTAFVWILSASLSIPEFALATTVHINQNVIFCTAVDSDHKINMHSLLATFNLFLPTVLMVIAAVLVIFKLKTKNLPDLDVCKSKTALKLSLWIILVYSVLCAPRSIADVYNVYSKSYAESQPSFEMKQLEDIEATTRLAFSGAYLSASLIRPLLYLIFLPRVRKMFSFGSKKMEKV